MLLVDGVHCLMGVVCCVVWWLLCGDYRLRFVGWRAVIVMAC